MGGSPKHGDDELIAAVRITAIMSARRLFWFGRASDRVCGKRLKPPLIPILVEAMERHGHLKLAPEVGMQLLAMGVVTIDRCVRKPVEPGTGQPRHR